MELHASLAARNYVVLILPSPFIQFHFPPLHKLNVTCPTNNTADAAVP